MNAGPIILALSLISHGTQGTDVIDSLALKADPQTTTPNNCTCTSICRCAIDYSDCDPGNPISWWPMLSTAIGEVRDWCYTADNCGEFSETRGYWDYCLYKDSSNQGYVSKSWKEKLNIIMERVKNSGPSSGKSFDNDINRGQSVLTTTDNEWDFMPAGRIKSLHPIGGVCKFEIHINNSIYSGVLKNGTRTGIMRVSVSVDGDYLQASTTGPFCRQDTYEIEGEGCKDSSPGASVALKFLRSGVSSGNVMLQRPPSSFKLPTYNIFDPEVNILSTHRNGLEYTLESVHGVIKGRQASRYSFAVGVSNLAKYDENGIEEEPIFPFKITLNPTGQVMFQEAPLSNKDFVQQFSDKIPDGTPIYSFITYKDPEDTMGTELGKVVNVGECYASQYGDEKLFFRHQRVEEDVELRPQWTNDYMMIPY